MGFQPGIDIWSRSNPAQHQIIYDTAVPICNAGSLHTPPPNGGHVRTGSATQQRIPDSGAHGLDAMDRHRGAPSDCLSHVFRDSLMSSGVSCPPWGGVRETPHPPPPTPGTPWDSAHSRCGGGAFWATQKIMITTVRSKISFSFINFPEN